MRKVLVCQKITQTIKTKAEQLGIPEIIVGIPPVMAGALKDVTLPAVVVESANNPYAFLLAISVGNTSKEQIDALVDIEPVTPAKSEFETFMLNAQPKLVLVNDHEAKLADLEARLKALEEK